ncbi:hypothetical protein ILYODFUR_012483 [Ilyodon furcidens]|uniref:Uncharacterized protein n=1 Tax=Ilyodon furcidens TaxID=33524 RepID=A0ABV0UJK1_9TELE
MLLVGFSPAGFSTLELNSWFQRLAVQVRKQQTATDQHTTTTLFDCRLEQDVFLIEIFQPTSSCQVKNNHPSSLHDETLQKAQIYQEGLREKVKISE